MTSPDMRNEAEHDPREDLPSFLREPDKIDKLLYASLMLVAVYGFAIIPFRAVLLLKYTFTYVADGLESLGADSRVGKRG